MSLIQQTNFSNTISQKGGLAKMQSPIQLIGNCNFGSTEQRAFFVEGGDNMVRVNESTFSSAFPFEASTLSRYRFITTTSTQGTQSNFRSASIMVQGSNSSTITYGIYLIDLLGANVESGSGMMDTALFTETLTTSASGIVIDNRDFSFKSSIINDTSQAYLLFPFIQNPNGANNLTLVNFTLY
tara:strand:+ start:82 stop:633 length:552 start_codon:yes stop_codon:yes gene_type:complete